MKWSPVTEILGTIIVVSLVAMGFMLISRVASLQEKNRFCLSSAERMKNLGFSITRAELDTCFVTGELPKGPTK